MSVHLSWAYSEKRTGADGLGLTPTFGSPSKLDFLGGCLGWNCDSGSGNLGDKEEQNGVRKAGRGDSTTARARSPGSISVSIRQVSEEAVG